LVSILVSFSFLLFFVKTGNAEKRRERLLFSFSPFLFLWPAKENENLKKTKKWVQRKLRQKKRPKTGQRKKKNPKRERKQKKKTTRNKSANRTILFHFSCSHVLMFSCSALVNAELLLIYPTDARNARSPVVAARNQ
jgi:hypothetical protein